MSATAIELCRRGGGSNGISLVEELIEIQDHYRETEPKTRLVQWVRNLKCLSVVHECGDVLYEKRLEARDMTAIRNYIAVSYPYEPMEEYESAESEGYTIISEDGSERKSEVRNIVIFRARRFAEFVGCSTFWIDRECVNQTDRRQKQVAMDSMNRVYKGSRYPIGLLSTEIRESSHVLSLVALLDGRFVHFDRSDAILVLTACKVATKNDILDLLELLQKDRWWQRAWIFQEEYLGGQRMKLLIRHTHDLELLKRQAFAADRGDERNRCPFLLIDGEICFPAALFREQATLFLLALFNDINSPPELQERCPPLIDCFGKYNILHSGTESCGKAMSTTIFKDIAARDIDQPFDFLPIAANCCNYSIRLKSQHLAYETDFSHSVGVCALALYLLNGELIHETEEIPELSTATSASQYIDDISFYDFDPPVDTGELTWLKNCRLPNVKLREDGIHTMGLVWRVYDEFDITGWQPAKFTQRKLSQGGLKPFQRNRLLQFAQKLRKAELNGSMNRTSRIPEEIEEYLEDDFDPQQLDEVKIYKDTMAREIVSAIDGAEQTLSLAVLEGSDRAFAVFVGAQNDGGNARIFTSWSSVYDENMRNRTRHVSLEATLVNKRTPPVVRYSGWVNGLTFWRGHVQQEVVVCWPATWKRIHGGLSHTISDVP